MKELKALEKKIKVAKNHMDYYHEFAYKTSPVLFPEERARLFEKFRQAEMVYESMIAERNELVGA